MPNPVRVEIVPRTVDADHETQAHRAQTVQRLADLGQLDSPESGQISPSMRDGWLARIDGVEVQVLAYSVEQGEDGSPVLSLAFSPASLTIGDPSLGEEQPQVRPSTPETVQPSSWGAPGPDPREGIPGWEPEGFGAQVARNAAVPA